MNEKLKALYEKYKDLIPYVIFGVLTTIVNYVSYWLFAHPLGCGTVFSTAVAWVLSVLFAYVPHFSARASARGFWICSSCTCASIFSAGTTW